MADHGRMLCTLLLPLLTQTFPDPYSFTMREPSSGPRVVLVCDRGPERVAAWSRFLDRYFDDVHLRAAGPSLDPLYGEVLVLDLEPGSVDERPQLWLPYCWPASPMQGFSRVLYGATGEATARAFGLLGAEHLSETLTGATDLTATWTGAEPRPLDMEYEPGDQLSPLPAAAFTGLHPPLARPLELAPEVGISVVAEDAAGREVALVWHQERYVHILLDLPPDQLPIAWQGVLARSIELAAGFDYYGGGGPLTPGADVPELDAKHQADRKLLGATDFLANRARDLSAAHPWTRAGARIELERHTGVSNWHPIPYLPEPGASAAAWRAFLDEHGDQLAFDALNLTWRWDWSAVSHGRPAGNLAPAERAEDLLPWIPIRALPAVESLFAAEALSEQLLACGRRAKLYAAAVPRSEFLGGRVFGTGEEARKQTIVGYGRAEVEERWRRAGQLAVLRGVDLESMKFDMLVNLAWREWERGPELLVPCAALLARKGPTTSSQPLLSLAKHERSVKADELEDLERRGNARLPSGELVPAFRALARHTRATPELFAELTEALAEAVEQAATTEEPVAWASAICRIDECIAALAVGLERELVADAQLDELVAMAKRYLPELPTKVQALLLGLLEGRRDEAALPLARAAWQRGIASLDPDDMFWSYSGPRPVDFGEAGLRGALVELSELPPGVRGELTYGLEDLLAEPGAGASLIGRLLDESGPGQDEPPLALRLASMAQDGRLVAELLDLVAVRIENETERRWWRRELAFTLGSPYVDRRPAEARLLAMLDDPDPWLRAFATWSLREPRGQLSAEVREALSARLTAEDPVVAALARDALFHGAQPASWRIRDVLTVEHPDREANASHLGPDPWADLEAENPVLRWRAAWHLAATQGQELIAELEAGDELAQERVARIECELRARIAELCELMDDEFLGGPGTGGLKAMQRVPLVELEHELMRPYRMPIGPWTYDELTSCLLELGPSAWPVYLASVHHWRGHGFGDIRGGTTGWGSADVESTIEPAWGELEADLLAPFLAMRFARDAVQGPKDISIAQRIDVDGEPSEAWVELWRNLGEPGRAALDELQGHPDPAVRAAAGKCAELL